MTPQERVKRYNLIAKTEKFVPARDKIKHVQEGLKKTQIKLQNTSKAISKLNSSKSMNPKIKALRVNRLRALQKFLTASIMLSKARISEFKSPT